MNIVIFGPPGAGKGTQSEKLVSDLGYFQISTGDLLRTVVKQNSKRSEEVRSFLDKGELVPSDLVIKLVVEEISEKRPSKFILDGIPRTIDQALSIDKIFLENNLKIKFAIFLSINSDELIDRLVNRLICTTCGKTYNKKTSRDLSICPNCKGALSQRSDDNEQVITNRLRVYNSNIEPIRNFYKEKKLFIEVDATANPDKVFNEIKKIIDKNTRH